MIETKTMEKIKLRKRKERKNDFYYILCGNNKLGKTLEETGLHIDAFYLLKIGVYSRLGNQIKKEALKKVKKIK